MTIVDFGDKKAEYVLIQPVDDHDLSVMENEVSVLRSLSERDFHLKAVKVDDWNRELSPWAAPAVFGEEGFGGRAGDTLHTVIDLCPVGRRCIIGGYSLAGLFALWAACRTNRFEAVAAASPSVWFPGFAEYMSDHRIQAKGVYLSLGDREERTKHPVMSTVGDRIRELQNEMQRQGICCTLEWNRGNHFKDSDRRTAKAFAWALNRDDLRA